jgi:hypothetical protein
LDICSKVSEKSWNFKSVLKQLNDELAKSERCEIVASTKNPQEEHKRGKRGKYFGPKDPTTTSAFVVGGNRENTFIYCAQPHLSILTVQ